MKVCSRCGTEKPLIQFFKKRSDREDLRYECKECTRKNQKIYREKNKTAIQKYKNQWYFDNIEKIKKNKPYNLQKYKYGISKIEREYMICEQFNQCYICNKLFNFNNPHDICTDHNHKTTQIRRILCHRCNQVLRGVNKDEDTTLEILDNSIMYLNKSYPFFKKYYISWKNKNRLLYNLLLQNANYQCEICKLRFSDDLKMNKENRNTYPLVDHNHSNGLIRGLLCYKCNFRLGHAKESKNILQSAKIYLIENKV